MSQPLALSVPVTVAGSTTATVRAPRLVATRVQPVACAVPENDTSAVAPHAAASRPALMLRFMLLLSLSSPGSARQRARQPFEDCGAGFASCSLSAHRATTRPTDLRSPNDLHGRGRQP